MEISKRSFAYEEGRDLEFDNNKSRGNLRSERESDFLPWRMKFVDFSPKTCTGLNSNTKRFVHRKLHMIILKKLRRKPHQTPEQARPNTFKFSFENDHS